MQLEEDHSPAVSENVLVGEELYSIADSEGNPIMPPSMAKIIYDRMTKQILRRKLPPDRIVGAVLGEIFTRFCYEELRRMVAAEDDHQGVTSSTSTEDFLKAHLPENITAGRKIDREFGRKITGLDELVIKDGAVQEYVKDALANRNPRKFRKAYTEFIEDRALLGEKSAPGATLTFFIPLDAGIVREDILRMIQPREEDAELIRVRTSQFRVGQLAEMAEQLSQNFTPYEDSATLIDISQRVAFQQARQPAYV